MINWLLGLQNLIEQVQQQYVESLSFFFIKEDSNYLKLFFSETDHLAGDLNQINQLSFATKFSVRYQIRSYNVQLCELIQVLKTTKILLKKCLIIETELQTLIVDWENELKRLQPFRLKLYNSLIDFFKSIREICNQTNSKYNELNDRLFSENQISKLSFDTFDLILDVNEFNYIKLKSLVQLIKLQISELLTIIIFFYSIDKCPFDENFTNLCSLLIEVTDVVQKFNNLIKEDCSFLIHFFLKTPQDQLAPKNDDRILDTKLCEILSNIRSAKTKVCASLLMIDQCLSRLLSENPDLAVDSERIVEELNSAISILKLLPRQSQTQIIKLVPKEVHKVDELTEIDNDNQIDASKNYQVPEYEVFEACIDQQKEKKDQSIEKSDYNIFQANAQYSKSLYGELKEVLDVKAKDHRTREAKALGIDERDLAKQHDECDLVMKKKSHSKYGHNVDSQTYDYSESFLNLSKLKESNIQSKVGFIINEENYGDDLSSDE